ncbi:hypothetical protein A1OQ_19280 [Enterovibrio norvegicus FF-162]|uniref:hypothetical protein n=1 Tax=Enterovibrio norvegicus TaxID=188144 RepID=UPI0002F8B2E1|nr:hypothetical protein [Enterovibrio norvegicus]OEE83124.1 hypothetical protein A1OQ_19280 [Enterovibrio norvegicus FF-162]
MKLTQYKKASVLALSAVLIAACGEDEAKTESVDEQKLSSLVKQTNYSTNFPPLFSDVIWGSTLDQQGTVRFDAAEQIPLYYVSKDGSNPPAVISNAVNTIEARLGNIFSDFTLVTEDLSVYRDNSLAHENVGNGSFNANEFKNSHGILGGLVIAQGTGFYSKGFSDSPQNMCANASMAPYDGSMALLIDPTSYTYAGDTLLWVNMGNGQCSWDSDIVVHEMAHAMGMYNHLDGYFGSWSTTAMDILATLYGNPAGTAYSSLVIKR